MHTFSPRRALVTLVQVPRDTRLSHPTSHFRCHPHKMKVGSWASQLMSAQERPLVYNKEPKLLGGHPPATDILMVCASVCVVLGLGSALRVDLHKRKSSGCSEGTAHDRLALACPYLPLPKFTLINICQRPFASMPLFGCR